MKWLVKLICPYRLHLKTKPWKYFGHECTLETKPLDLKVSIQNYSMQFLFPLIGKFWEFKTFPGAWKKGIIVKIATVGATHDSANSYVNLKSKAESNKTVFCGSSPYRWHSLYCLDWRTWMTSRGYDILLQAAWARWRYLFTLSKSDLRQAALDFEKEASRFELKIYINKTKVFSLTGHCTFPICNNRQGRYLSWYYRFCRR